ncbi:hypothetical protein KO317_03635 [Candidatus Micrarchaeota archaeon]|nr:hypothetical protein [Candidatus Micrarchaeota archaeon]
MIIMKRSDKKSKITKINPIYSLMAQLDFKLVFASMFIFISLWGLVFAADELECILLALCNQIMGIIPSLAFLLVTVAAVAYAGGQLFDAQTRARAQQWAISCIIGAIIGAVILIIVPAFLGALIKMSAGPGLSISCSETGMCTEALIDAEISVGSSP